MPAEQPTILATPGGFNPGSRTRLGFDPLLPRAIELSGVSGQAPKAHTGTAAGDQRALAEGAREQRLEPRYLG